MTSTNEDTSGHPRPARQPMSVEEVRGRVAAYTRDGLGVPAALDPDALEPDGAFLLPVARLLRETAMVRLRLLERAATGGEQVAGDAVRFAAVAAEGRVPWDVSCDAVVKLASLTAAVRALDDLLPKIAEALVESAVAAGVIEPRQPVELPMPPVRQDTPRLGDVVA